MTEVTPKAARKVPTKRKRKKAKKRVRKQSVVQEAKKSAEPVPKRPVGRPRKNILVNNLTDPTKPAKVVAAPVDFIGPKLRYVRGFLPEDAPENATPKWESLQAISAALNIPISTLKWHSAKEGWPDERLAFQAKLGQRMKDITTRKLALQQAGLREGVHALARASVNESLRLFQQGTITHDDIVKATSSAVRALRAGTEAADPDAAAALVLPGGGSRWMLIRAGLDPVQDAEVLEVFAEEDAGA